MKIKNILIGIKSPEQGLREFANAFRNAQRGKISRKRQEGVYFTNLEAMRKVLTPKRIELLHIIRDKKPHSVYELTQIVKRDLKNVQDDVALLARIGLLSLSRAKQARERVVPRVDYNNIQLQIPVHYGI